MAVQLAGLIGASVIVAVSDLDQYNLLVDMGSNVGE